MGGIAQRKLMKDGVDSRAVARLAANIARAWPAFDAAGFAASAGRGLADLELKQRVSHVATALASQLPAAVPDALAVLVRAATTWDPGEASDPLRGFAAWPVFHYIETHGGSHFDASMDALRRLTHLFTGELAVRRFIRDNPDRAFEVLTDWTRDASDHVRRLASESSRPRLPWASRLPAAIQADPAPVLAILELLRDDASPYVRRSVANNLADIAKDHPQRVVDICQRWLADDASPPHRQGRDWIVRRATRNLVKAGHPAVWGLLGYTTDPAVAVESLALSPNAVELGNDLRIRFDITSTGRERQRIVVDYAVHHVKANGQRRPKVFKLRDVELAPGQALSLDKHHPLRRITTRTYYAGRHQVDVLINGVARASAEFTLRV